MKQRGKQPFNEGFNGLKCFYKHLAKFNLKSWLLLQIGQCDMTICIV